MKNVTLKRFLTISILFLLLVFSLAVSVGALSRFKKSFQSETENWASAPAAGSLSYAYPGSERSGSPGYFDSTHGAVINDNSAYVVTVENDPATTEDDVWEFISERDFSVVLTYTLTAQEAARADLSETPVFKMSAGVENALNLDRANCKFKLAFYTNSTEFFEIVAEYPILSGQMPYQVDLAPYIASLSDTTLEKIVLTPFYRITEQEGTTYRYQRLFFLKGYALFQSAEHEALLSSGTIVDASDVETAESAGTLAILTSPTSIVLNQDALNGAANWIVSHKTSLNIKMASVLGLLNPPNAGVSFNYYDINTAKATDHGGIYSSSVSAYIEALLLDPTLPVTAGGTLKTSETLHQGLNNLALAVKTITDAGIPVSLSYGQKDMAVIQSRNHSMIDLYFRTGPGDAADSASLDPRTTVSFSRTVLYPSGTYGVDYGNYNSEVSFATYSNWSGGVQNTWYTFRAGETDYLVITVEQHPTRNVRTWMRNLAAAHSDKKIILITTGYMSKNGDLFTIWDDEAGGTVYQGQSLAVYVPAEYEIYNGFGGTGTWTAMKYYTTPMQAGMWADSTDGIVFWNNHLSRIPNLMLIIDGGEKDGCTSLYNDPQTGKAVRVVQTDYANDLVVRYDKGIYGNRVTTVSANPTTLLSGLTHKKGALLLVKLIDEDSFELSYYFPEYDAYINPDDNIILVRSMEKACGLFVTGTGAPDTSDGKITGLDPTYLYQYKPYGADDSSYLTLPLGTVEITGLAAGKYTIRTVGTTNSPPSPAVDYAVDTAALEALPYWNMFPYASLSDAQLAALGYDITLGDNGESGSTRTDVARNSQRTAEFNKIYNTTVTNGASLPSSGWRYVTSSGSPLAVIGYGSGFYAARYPNVPNDAQYFVYVFSDEQLFEVSQYPYFEVYLSHHSVYTYYPSYAEALSAAGVMPRSKILIYFYGQTEPYEYISTLSTETPTYQKIKFKIPDTVHGRVQRVEIYPIYRYWPTGATGDIEGHSYNITGTGSGAFYSTYASHIRNMGFFASDADATAAVNSGGSPSITRENAYNWSDLNPAGALGEDDFTIAVITNTEKIAPNSGKMNALAQYLVDHRTDLKLKMVLHAGGVVDGSYSNNYWKPAANYDDIVGIGDDTTFSSYNAILLYLMSAGAVTKADGTYDERIKAPSINAANAFRILTDAGIPLSVNSYITENLGGYLRGPILSGYLNADQFHITGRMTILFSEIRASLFTVSNQNVSALVSGGKLVLENNPYISDHYSYENTYYIFRQGDIDYLVLSLEAYPRKSVRSWANDLIAANYNKRVIVSVSGLLDGTGDFVKCFCMNDLTNPGTYTTNGGQTWQRYDAPRNGQTAFFAYASDGSAANTAIRSFNTANYDDPCDGDELWRLVLQKHANIMLVIDGGNGRAGSKNTTSLLTKEMTGVNGNKVYIAQARYDGLLGADSGAYLFVQIRNDGKQIDLLPFHTASGTYAYSYSTLEYPVYNVTVAEGVTGISELTGVLPGETVTLSISPASGMKLKAGSMKVSYEYESRYYTGIFGSSTYLSASTVPVERVLIPDGDGIVSFVMPHADVEITSAEYHPISQPNIALSAAGIRLDGTSGIRFLATFYLDGVDITYKNLWSYGILVIPTVLIDAANPLSFKPNGSLGRYVVDIPLKKYYQYAVDEQTRSGYFRYTGVITGIPSLYYTTDLSAVAYVKYTTNNGSTWHYAYSNVLKRNYFDLAQSALLSGRESAANEAILSSIVKIPVAGVAINQTNVTLAVSDKITVTPTVFPENATDKRLIFSSDNPAVAAVSHNLVTAVQAGTATITVTTNDGAFTDSFVVTVS